MQQFLQNKYVRLGLAAVGILVALFIALFVLALLNTSTSGLGISEVGMDEGYSLSAPMAPSFSNSFKGGTMMDDDMAMEAESSYTSSYYPEPFPTPGGYTSDLESYETTSYNINARTKDFDGLCGAVANLKNDPQIHFRSITSSLNNCYASFFVTEERVAGVITTLTGFRGVEVNRNTESVTRHKEQLESQTVILQQQLTRVESSLVAAQAQLDRLNQIFNTSDEVTRLSSEVTKSLQYIDQLTQRKISLISQLDDIYQQSADLAERMKVVQFDVQVNRANPIIIDKYERQWDNAWEELKDAFTETLIGLTAFFGIFLLWVVRIGLYLLVVLVLVRGLWKFAKLLWSRW
ncbi:MAG: hypothetical protein KBC35_04170 [Candidatus Pacebacteria bacterium]|nr:hypothetical protein [Candidatus Paceibacterota bacterium]